jgi:hypothetical protein
LRQIQKNDWHSPACVFVCARTDQTRIRYGGISTISSPLLGERGGGT